MYSVRLDGQDWIVVNRAGEIVGRYANAFIAKTVAQDRNSKVKQ